jgi:hypothetical protein
MTTRLRRDQFTDEEWALYKSGKCCNVIAHGMPYVRWCEKPIDPNSRHGNYCTDCDQLMRDLYPDTY